jgi:hypothetical protein
MSQSSPDQPGHDCGPDDCQTASRWFYVQHGETYGPVSFADLRAAAHLGFVGPADMVRRADGAEWIQASSIRGLFRNSPTDRPSDSSTLFQLQPPLLLEKTAMSTAGLRVTPFESAFQMPPAPSGLRGSEPFSEQPPAIRTHRPAKRRKQRVPVLEMAIVGGLLLFLSYFAMSLIGKLQLVGPAANQTAARPGAKATVPAVALGGGAPGSIVPRSNPPAVPSPDPVAPKPVIAPSEQDIEQLVQDGIKACREGWFEAAVDLGREVARLAPNDPRGKAVQLLALYAEQYPKLADEAIDRMNGAVEVYLGRRYGLGAFVERNGDELVFMANGRHVRLTVRELIALDGVRFRVTKQYLENGNQPANDLILGAIHYPKQLKRDGTFDQTGVLSQQAARDRWETAARTHDEQVADHARSLLSLLEASETARVREGQR